MIPIIENSSLYSVVELGRASLTPAKALVQATYEMSIHPLNPFSYTVGGKITSASCEVFERILRYYPKPEFGIDHSFVNGRKVDVIEKCVNVKTFCRLLHFEKQNMGGLSLPKLLIVAPMSGHFSTLLRGTVEGTLPFFDVYITDWTDAKDISADLGPFTFQDYVSYCLDYMRQLAPNLSVMAVCQPSVPVITAITLMSIAKDKAIPSNMILVGGPIDTTISPTGVNKYAKSKDVSWFENNVITRVPMNYPGFMRPVYPGFLQLMGFMSMNLKRHIGEHINLFKHLVEGDGESAEHHRKFYDEYLAVMDLPAEFYLETIEIVFREHSLPLGKLEVLGEKIDLRAITDCRLLVIEGELDDISGIGQTKAAIDLCTNIANTNKHYLLQEGVGHYGLFNGRKFREFIVPKIVSFVNTRVEK